jgi:hypothetical protein
MPSFLLIQWGIIGFFVFIHFLIGFLRGTRKSTYFTLVSLLMTVVTIWIVSNLSLNLIFSSGMTFQSLIDLINGFAGGVIPDDVITYLNEPQILGVAIAIIDLVIRIIAFIILYPILKFSITFTIFKPIWKRIILPILLKKQNENAKLKYEETNNSKKKFVPRKRLNKNIFGRLGGAAIGSVRGLVVAFVFLVPLLVIAGFASEVNNNVNVAIQNQDTQLSADTQVASVIPSEVQDILDNIEEMNNGGLSAIVRDIKVEGKSLDRYIFDTVFTTDIVIEDVKTPINFGNELEQIVGIASILVQNGYLDNYDFNNFSSADIDNVELIFNHIGQSELIGYMIPAAVRYGVENLAPDFLEGVILSDRAASQDALDAFYDISWDEEFLRIFGIADAALTFASIGEWQTYLDQPELLAELTPEEGILFANIFRAFGDLEVLSLVNVALDYATTLQEVQQQITWMEPAEVEGYLQDKFAFVLDDPTFFSGSEGEIYRIAQIIETVFSDEFGDANLSTLIDSFDDPEALIENQNPEWVGAIIADLVEVKLFIEAIPIGVDFAFYTQLRDSVDDDLADQIIAELEIIEWDNEINNVADIYKEALKLGISAVFGDNPDYYQLIDNIAVDHMDSLRSIVEYVFEGSDVVNAAIELASPVIVDRFVTDEALNQVIMDVLISDPVSGEVDFNFGQELNNVLSIVESVFQFTTASELATIADLETNELLEVISQFGTLTETEYLELRTAINSLQILNRAGQSGLEYIQTQVDLPNLYVPETVELNNDFTVLIDIAYEIANYIQEKSPLYLDYQEIDFTDLLADDDFRAYFLATDEDKHSNLIFLNIAHNIKYFSEDESLSNYISLPDDLILNEIDTELWETEVNALLESIFDLASTIGGTPNVELSLQGLSELASDPTNLSIEVFTQFSDETLADDAFGNLDSSRILRKSLVKTIDTIGAGLGDSLYGLELTVPAHLVSEGMLLEGTLTNLIYSIAVLVDDMNGYMGFDTINEAISHTNNYDYVSAFNQVSDANLQIFGSADLIHGIISDILLNPDLQAQIRDVINNTQPLGISVDDDFLSLTRDSGVLGEYEFSDLLIALKAAEFTPELLGDFSTQMYTYIQTLDQSKLDLLFDPYLLRELIDQVIANQSVLDTIVSLAEEQFSQIKSTQTILAGINPNLEHIISSLPNIKDADGFFDTNEIKSWILAFKELEITSIEDLNALGNIQNIHEKIQTSFVIETLFESKWLYGLVNDAFTLESTLEQIAALATDQVYKQTGVSQTFTIDDISFIADKYQMLETVGANAGKVKVSELKNFFLAGTRLNWTDLGLGSGTTLISNLANELLSTGFDGERHIDVIFNSKLLVAILDKVLNFEYNSYNLDEIAISFVNTKLATIAALDGVVLTADILDFDLRVYDDQNVIKKDEFIQMLEAVTYMDFDQPIGINTFYQMTVDGTFHELFDSKIIHSLISNILTNQAAQDFGVNKANSAQSIVVLSNDILAVDPELMDGDLFKVSELENILVALHTLGLTDSAGFSSIGIPTFTNLLGSNIDPITGEDDFDRVFSANYIYVLLDRILKLDSLGDYVGSLLGDSLGISITSFDTTPSDAMLADDSVQYEAIEENRIPKDEFRAMINSLNILGDLGAIGLNTFTDMIDPNQATDDFTIFIDSDYIYTIIARLFDNDAFGDYVGDMLAGAFGDDPITLDMSTPEDALGLTGVEEDLMTRYELRQLMVSFDMLGFDGSSDISVETILNMIDQNIDPVSGEDDFSRFIESIYIQDKVSQLLLSQQVIELIANSRFDYVDFVMPANSLVTVGTSDRMIKQEIYDLFYGLKLVGLTDFDNVDISLDSITSLTEPEQDQLLSSSYLYVTLDLMLKSEATLTVPSDALEIAGNFDGMIKKTEIKDLLSAFSILGDSDPANIDVDTVTIADLEDMLDLESNIIDQLVSDAIEDNLTTIPITAYNLAGTRISRDELYKMIETLLVLAGGDDQQTLSSLMPIDTDTITTAMLQDIHDIDSRIVDRITSEAIIDSGISIHSLAYDPLSEDDGAGQKLDIKRSELADLIEALDILDIDINNAGAIDQSKFTPTNVGLLLDLESVIVYRLISEGIIDQGLETDESLAQDGIDDNYDPLAIGSDIKVSEMEALVEAMNVLGISNLTDPIDVTTVSVAQLEQTHWLGLGIDPSGDVYQSRIIHRLISDAVDDNITVPDDAYMTIDLLDVKADEISALIEALSEMGLTTLADPINVDTLTVAQLRNINYLGLEIDPSGDEYQSITIHRLISDAVVDSLYSGDPLQAPDGVFMTVANEDLIVSEISALIEALDAMGLTTLGDPIDVDSLTIVQLENVHYLGLGTDPSGDYHESLIIHRLISDAVVDSLYSGDPLQAPNGIFMTAANDDMLADEVSALIEALGEMGLSTLADPINVDALTVVQLRNINYLGLEIDPSGDVYQSLAIHRLISDAVVDSLYSGDPLQAPDGVFMTVANEDLIVSEISALIEALDAMGLTTLGDPINVDSLTILQLENVHYLGLGTDPSGDDHESLIIHRLIGDAVVDSLYTGDPLLAPDGVFMTPANEDLLATEISALIEALGEMGLTTLADPINVDDLTLVQLENIHYLGLGTHPTNDEYESLIIHRLISDAVVDSLYAGDPLQAPDGVFMTVANEDLLATEISALIGALGEMGLTKLSDPINVDNLTLTQLENIHFLGLGTHPTNDEYESLIIHRLISDSVISTVTVPDDAYMTAANEDVKPLEISALIEALGEMGLTKLSDPIDVDNLSLLQLENIHYLGLGTDPSGDVHESLIIHRLISDAVVDSLYAGDPLQAPDGVFMTVANEDLLAIEISALIEALSEMGLTKLSDPINVDNLTLTQLENIHFLGLGTHPTNDEYESLIIHRLISDSVISTVTVPDDAYMTAANEDVKPLEISALIEALGEMGLTKLSDPIDVDNLSLLQLENIHYLGLGTDPSGDVHESLIIHRLISDAVVDSLYAGDPLQAPDGVFMTVANEDLLADEVSALIEAMEEMGITSLGASLSISNPTVSQLQELHYLGLADDPSGDVYESLIVHRLISDSIISALTVPDEAYMTAANEDVKEDEISALIEAMNEMGIVSLSAGLSVSNPSRTQLQNLHDIGLNVPVGNVYDSYIVHRLISDSIDAALDIPDEAYDSVAQDDIEVDEISALIEAMEEMGITTLSAGLSVSNPSRTQLQNLHNLGLNIPVGNVYDSYIVHRLISDSIDAALDVPDEAYDSVAQDDIKVDEISALIEAMAVMNITTLSSGLSFSNPTTTQIQELNYLGLGTNPTPGVGYIEYDSYIVHRLLSDAVSAAITVPAGSYIVGRPEDIKADEIDHLIETMGILDVTDVNSFAGITTTDISNLNGGTGLSAQDIEDITETSTSGPNLIVYYFMSNLVDPGNNLYPDLDPLSVDPSDDPYVMSGITRVRLERASLATALAAL